MTTTFFHAPDLAHSLAEVADLPGAVIDRATGGYRVVCPLTPNRRGKPNLLITHNKYGRQDKQGNLLLHAHDFNTGCPFTPAEHLAALGLANPLPRNPDKPPAAGDSRFGAGYQPGDIDYRNCGFRPDAVAPAITLARSTTLDLAEYPGNVAPFTAAPHSMLIAPVTPEDGARYLADKDNVDKPYGVIEYLHCNGRRAKHVRRRLPDGSKDAKTYGNKGNGWYVRLWQPDLAAYQLALARAAGVAVIFVTEGEKDAAILQGLGYWVVSTPGGAGRANSLLYDPLLDKARELGAVIILAQDNDTAGYDWGDNVARILKAHGVDVYRPCPGGLPHGDSLADFPDGVDLVATGARNRYRLPPDLAAEVDPALFGPVDLIDVGYLAPGRSTKVTIPEPMRKAELPCLEPGRRIVSTALRPAFAGARGVVADVDRLLPCGKCENCYHWEALRKGNKWAHVASQLPGQQSAIDFDPMGKADVDYALKRVRRLLEGQWAHASIIAVAQPLEVDNDGVIAPQRYLYRALIWTLLPLRKRHKDAILAFIYRGKVNADKRGNRWAIDRPAFTDGLTITANDFAAALPTRTIPWLNGKARRTSGFWDWGIRYPGNDEKPDTFAEANDGKVNFDLPGCPDTAPLVDVYLRERERKYLPTGVSEGQLRAELLAAVGDSDEERRRNPGKARLLNARVWVARMGRISEADFDKAKGDYLAGLTPWLPGYRGPKKLLAGAIRLALGLPVKRENLTAYMMITAKVGAAAADTPDNPKPDLAGQRATTANVDLAPDSGATRAARSTAPSKLNRKLRGALARPGKAPSDKPDKPDNAATWQVNDSQVNVDLANAAAAAAEVECNAQGLAMLSGLLPVYELTADTPAVDAIDLAERQKIAAEFTAYAEWLAPSTDSDKRDMGARFSSLAARLTAAAVAPDVDLALAGQPGRSSLAGATATSTSTRSTATAPEWNSGVDLAGLDLATPGATPGDTVDVDGWAVDLADIDPALLDSQTWQPDESGRYGVSAPCYGDDLAPPDWAATLAESEIGD